MPLFKKRKTAAKTKYKEQGMKAVFAALRQPKPPGMAMIRRAGQYTADPQEVEDTLRQSWDDIYNPDNDDQHATARDYFNKYGQDVFDAPEHQIAP